LYQAVTLGFAEETADVLTLQMYGFLSRGYLRAREDELPEPRAGRKAAPKKPRKR
jgi:hypothetical protein